MRLLEDYKHKKLLERAAFNAKKIAPLFKSGQNVLDFGAGDMATALWLKNNLSVNITGTDMIDFRLSETKKIPFVLFDGHLLPFKDKEFDVALCCFVLHHTRVHEQYLKELMRIGGKVIIVEDVFSTIGGKIVLYAHDWIGNRIESSSIPTPMTFRSDKQWKKLFSKLNLRIIETLSWAPTVPFMPFRHVAYVVKSK